MDNLTYNAGTYIRDALRGDASFLSILGIPTLDAKDTIFFGRPVDQRQGFANPRVVIESLPSDPGALAYTGIYRGTEVFKLHIWCAEAPYDVCMKALDRAATLFTQTVYPMTDNIGEFSCNAKFSGADPDKLRTTHGEMIITLSIGGI